MVQLDQPFDPAGAPPPRPFDPVPAGVYRMAIVDSEAKDAKGDKGNRYVNLKLLIVEGEHEGRTVFDILNLWNDNATAVEIAQRTLADICTACGIAVLKNTEQLYGIEMEVKLGVQPARTTHDGHTYEASNKVKAYRAIEGSQPQHAPQRQPAPTASPQQRAPAATLPAAAPVTRKPAWAK